MRMERSARARKSGSGESIPTTSNACGRIWPITARNSHLTSNANTASHIRTRRIAGCSPAGWPFATAMARGLRMAGSLTDITEGKVSDPLTGLPNRIHLMERLERAIERSRRCPGIRFALLFLDVDRFKMINDSLGHLIGDQLLIAFARRMEACLRKTDTLARIEVENTLARLGGDEFTILAEGINDVGDAISVAERIQRELSRAIPSERTRGIHFRQHRDRPQWTWLPSAGRPAARCRHGDVRRQSQG